MEDQIINERLNLLSPEYRSYLASADTVGSVAIVAGEENLAEEQVAIFNNAVALFLLGFFDTDQSVQFLVSEVGLPQTLARAMFGAVLTTIPAEILAAQAEIHTALSDTTPVTPAATVTPASPVIPVPPVRTMADDVAEAQAEPTYTSSQDALLRPSQPTDTNPTTAG